MDLTEVPEDSTVEPEELGALMEEVDLLMVDKEAQEEMDLLEVPVV